MRSTELNERPLTRRAGSNRSTIRSARKCYLCLRNELNQWRIARSCVVACRHLPTERHAHETVNEMKIVQRSPRDAPRAEPAPKHWAESRSVPYMATALAYQLFPDDDQNDSELPEGKMGFLDHLEELRKRIVRSCIAIAAGMLIAFVFIDRIVAFVLAPTRRMLPAGTKLIYTNPAEAFSLYIDIALISGVLLALPFIMFQVWRFIAPGLYAKEKKFAIPFVLLTTVGALGGAAFSHYIMFPYLIAFFGTFNSPDLAFMPRVEDAFDLYTKMLLGMVVVFQIPTLAFFLAKMRLVTAGFLWRNFKYAFLAIFIIAAVLTPTADPWNQTVFAAPMVGLYLISILIVWMVQPKGETRF
jgi:sec-independent protein translocase protein TatC